ncbi:sugar dehydratase [Candidatus Uhrbacteria bacterium CG_4_9_14_3_um_filter_36_7]|uniref:Sugar dehydratase n=1 Tax=Candidatus Uhrbacteria bacterium CG_4_9_14_3_um_filter_36_7 TaxID=1975033 RepID=A0A2M7XI12_9BACT|nr:MAG: sugar dehydratase [Candidatus Uhrbacteria bacterium CG_4_9_14_3_um_filter_36_7]
MKQEFITPQRQAFWKNRRVFVTGAFGLLGSTLTEFLTRFGAEVVVLQRDHVPSSRLFETRTHEKVIVVRGDVEDYATLFRALNDYEIDTVFHLAAQAIAPIANRCPLPTFRTNLMGTCNILEAARLSPKVTRVVVASSDKAYGAQPVLPYSEDAPLQGQHPYDVSKSCKDLLAQAYFHTYKLPVCITRCGNLYGPGDFHFNRVIPGTIKSILMGERPIIRSDGKYIRDYFFVKDAANGYMTIVEHMDDASHHGHAYNLSTGNRFNVIDIVNRILQVMGSSLEPIILNEANSEIREQTLCSDKAFNRLGWKPAYAVEEALLETIEWYKQFFNRQKQEQKFEPASFETLLS